MSTTAGTSGSTVATKETRVFGRGVNGDGRRDRWRRRRSGLRRRWMVVEEIDGDEGAAEEIDGDDGAAEEEEELPFKVYGGDGASGMSRRSTKVHLGDLPPPFELGDLNQGLEFLRQPSSSPVIANHSRKSRWKSRSSSTTE
ncbi:hypothetical protein E3N88_08160 [Mikania micrantha]|uniref:Uncharacterized protein n=1 Tax=Mikania micrantha TaxID=192012 RepID=A0A5N6PII7_9ASTR|nr:hypothetical protein E3N88_08160 [Mikania micrantha]